MSTWCPWCDFSVDDPEDCVCEDNCGETACSGSKDLGEGLDDNDED